jgi:hypothetical protein
MYAVGLLQDFSTLFQSASALFDLQAHHTTCHCQLIFHGSDRLSLTNKKDAPSERDKS